MSSGFGVSLIQKYFSGLDGADALSGSDHSMAVAVVLVVTVSVDVVWSA